MKSSIPGSGNFGWAEAHIFWFGQPAHADDLPAFSLSVPGQPKGLGKFK